MTRNSQLQIGLVFGFWVNVWILNSSCTGADLTAWTNGFQNIQCYDTLKVNAILDEIDGKNHDGN